MNELATPAGRPWWRYPLVWLVVAGPAWAITAGMATVYLALSHPDPVVTPDYYRKGIEINRELANNKMQLPAMAARNHVTTPPGTAPAPRP